MSWKNIMKREPPITKGSMTNDLRVIIGYIEEIIEDGCGPNSKQALAIKKVTQSLMEDIRKLSGDIDTQEFQDLE